MRDKKKGKSPNFETNEKIFKHFESNRIVANRKRTKKDGTF